MKKNNRSFTGTLNCGLVRVLGFCRIPTETTDRLTSTWATLVFWNFEVLRKSHAAAPFVCSIRLHGEVIFCLPYSGLQGSCSGTRRATKGWSGPSTQKDHAPNTRYETTLLQITIP